MGKLSDQRQREPASPRSPTTDRSGASSAAAPQPLHRRLRELADDSPRVQQFARLQDAADRATTGSARTAGMPAELKLGIEGLSGLSMGDVTVHYDSPRPARQVRRFPRSIGPRPRAFRSFGAVTTVYIRGNSARTDSIWFDAGASFLTELA